MPFINPTDWRAYFVGDWRMSRTINDRRDARAGKATGDAVFAERPREENAAAICTETLSIAYGGRCWFAKQTTLWRFVEPDGPQLFFEDGRPLCEMKFEHRTEGWRAEFLHLCGEDRYKGAASLIDKNAWRLCWNVTGPRKDYLLDTMYRRPHKTGAKSRATKPTANGGEQ